MYPCLLIGKCKRCFCGFGDTHTHTHTHTMCILSFGFIFFLIFLLFLPCPHFSEPTSMLSSSLLQASHTFLSVFRSLHLMLVHLPVLNRKCIWIGSLELQNIPCRSGAFKIHLCKTPSGVISSPLAFRTELSCWAQDDTGGTAEHVQN